MLIPINTDAPIYHFPAATIGLIILNVVAFIATGAGFRPDLVDPWILWFGEIKPHQWLTAFFMHADFLHLIGNMIFLWAFGLVVEGKLGWKVFIPLYLIMGISQCAVEQVIMLGSDREAARQEQLDRLGLEDQDIDPFGLDGLDGEELDEFDDVDQGAFLQIDDLPPWPGDDDLDEDDPFAEEEVDEVRLEFETRRERALLKILQTQPIMFGALGASGVIYSLLAMSLIWAPKNELTIVGLIVYRPVSFDMPIMWFAGGYIALDFLMASVSGMQMSTPFLHTMGAITGGIFGVVMFKMRKVDCEGWDLFSVLSGNYGSHARDVYGYEIDAKDKGKRTAFDEETEQKKKKKKAPGSGVLESLEAGHYLAASEELFNLRIKDPRFKLPEAELKELAQGLVAEKEYEEAEAILDEYIEQYPKTANWACIRLAAIQLQANGQPRAALGTLKKVNKETLTDKERATGKKLAQAAKEQVRAGVQDREPEW